MDALDHIVEDGRLDVLRRVVEGSYPRLLARARRLLGGPRVPPLEPEELVSEVYLAASRGVSGPTSRSTSDSSKGC